MISQVINGDPIMSMVQLDYVLVYLTAVLLDCCRLTTYPATGIIGICQEKNKTTKTVNSILYILYIFNVLLKDSDYLK